MCLNVVQHGGPRMLVKLRVLSTYVKALVGTGDVLMCKIDTVPALMELTI